MSAEGVAQDFRCNGRSYSTRRRSSMPGGEAFGSIRSYSVVSDRMQKHTDTVTDNVTETVTDTETETENGQKEIKKLFLLLLQEILRMRARGGSGSRLVFG